MEVTDVFSIDIEELTDEQCLIRMSFLARNIYEKALELTTNVSHAQGALEGSGQVPRHAIARISNTSDSIAQDSHDFNQLQDKLKSIRAQFDLDRWRNQNG